MSKPVDRRSPQERLAAARMRLLVALTKQEAATARKQIELWERKVAELGEERTPLEGQLFLAERALDNACGVREYESATAAVQKIQRAIVSRDLARDAAAQATLDAANQAAADAELARSGHRRSTGLGTGQSKPSPAPSRGLPAREDQQPY